MNSRAKSVLMALLLIGNWAMRSCQLIQKKKKIRYSTKKKKKLLLKQMTH